MKYKVINAGKCMLCGKPIKFIPRRGSAKTDLPNIFFCWKCELKLVEYDQKRPESEDNNGI